MTIILADHDPELVRALSKRICRACPDIQILLLSEPDPDSSSLLIKTPALAIINPADFPALSKDLEKSVNGQVECWFLMQTCHDPKNRCFSRLGASTDLISQISAWSDQHQADLDGTDQTHPDCPDIQRGQLHFLFSADWRTSSVHYSRYRLENLIACGLKIIYLPLMPTYQMGCISSDGQAAGLSSLMIRLLDSQSKSLDLGHYLQPHPDGYLQFRPADRSDDLVMIDKDMVRRLIRELKNYLDQDNASTAVLVDCAGLPMSTARTVAVLCDSCEIILPQEGGFASESARLETGRLLAELPSECRVSCRVSKGGHLHADRLSGTATTHQSGSKTVEPGRHGQRPGCPAEYSEYGGHSLYRHEPDI